MLAATLLIEGRKRAGLSQSELGRRAGVPANVISRWERGEVALGMDRLISLLQACGLSLDISLRAADDSNRTLISAYRGLAPQARLQRLVRQVQTVAEVQGRDESFDPAALIGALRASGTRFIVIGGVAASLHGGPHPTYDLDIVPAPGPRNAARLRRALGPSEPEDAPGAARWHTPHGDVQAVAAPPGTAGYADLDRGAVTMTVDGGDVRVAALIDVVRMKDADGRADQRAVVNDLRELAAA